MCYYIDVNFILGQYRFGVTLSALGSNVSTVTPQVMTIDFGPVFAGLLAVYVSQTAFL